MLSASARTQAKAFLWKVIFQTPWFWGLMFLTLIPVFGFWFFLIREQLYQGNLPREPYYEEHQNAVANDLAKLVKVAIVSGQEGANLNSVQVYQARLQMLSMLAITDPRSLENLTDGERTDLERFENDRKSFSGVVFYEKDDGSVVLNDKYLESLDLESESRTSSHVPRTCEEAWATIGAKVTLPTNRKDDRLLLESNRRNERQAEPADPRSGLKHLERFSEYPPIATTGEVSSIGLQHFFGLEKLRFNFVHEGILEAQDGTQFALIDDLSITDVEVTASGKLIATIGYQLFRAPYIKTRFDIPLSGGPLIVDKETMKNTELLDQIRITQKHRREMEQRVFESLAQIWTTESLEFSLAPIPNQKSINYGGLSCPVTSIRLNCRPSPESANFCSSFVLPRIQHFYGYDPRNRSLILASSSPTWGLLEPVFARMSILVAAQNGVDTDRSSAFTRMMYFSIVNMTTLGYGDIVPITTYARILVGLQSVLGIIFIGFFLNAFANPQNR